MSDLLPVVEVPPEQKNKNEEPELPPPQPEMHTEKDGSLQIRMIPGEEPPPVRSEDVFPDLMPAKPVKKKRTASVKQLAHLKKAREIAMARRKANREAKDAEKQASLPIPIPVHHEPDTSSHEGYTDLQEFADIVIERYEERQSKARKAKQVTHAPEPDPAPAPIAAQFAANKAGGNDAAYEFWQQFF